MVIIFANLSGFFEYCAVHLQPVTDILHQIQTCGLHVGPGRCQTTYVIIITSSVKYSIMSICHKPYTYKITNCRATVELQLVTPLVDRGLFKLVVRHCLLGYFLSFSPRLIIPQSWHYIQRK